MSVLDAIFNPFSSKFRFICLLVENLDKSVHHFKGLLCRIWLFKASLT